MSCEAPLLPRSEEQAVGRAMLRGPDGGRLRKEAFVACAPLGGGEAGRFALLTDKRLALVRSRQLGRAIDAAARTSTESRAEEGQHGTEGLSEALLVLVAAAAPDWEVESEVLLADVHLLERTGTTVSFIVLAEHLPPDALLATAARGGDERPAAEGLLDQMHEGEGHGKALKKSSLRREVLQIAGEERAQDLTLRMARHLALLEKSGSGRTFFGQH
eukprot:TRINITY_DN32383_c0_g1_i1.p1 TRINITY_DN32383_c0_g1~~TRINITY_DN32383_c0_g1_i1.p1  ORF type:complete len:217 (-),score=53.27 TRINITY_DN32383_c0_g1_i1:629-1279(-)